MLKHKAKLSWYALLLTFSLTFFLSAESRGGPAPPPPEVELDLAEYVVVGKISGIKVSSEGERTGIATATITVTKTLKGPAKDQIEAKVYVGGKISRLYNFPKSSISSF